MSKSEIIQVLSAHKNKLDALGVDRIGLVNAPEQNHYSRETEIDLIVDLKRNKKDFHHFMSLATFLEKTLSRKINLMLMQPRHPYLSAQVLDRTEFISMEKRSWSAARSFFSRDGQSNAVKWDIFRIRKKE